MSSWTPPFRAQNKHPGAEEDLLQQLTTGTGKAHQRQDGRHLVPQAERQLPRLNVENRFL
jgi:hypothetical protein